MKFAPACVFACCSSLVAFGIGSNAAAMVGHSSTRPVAASVATDTKQNHWIRPVSGPVVRQFVAPSTPYGPGHRGIDIQTAMGSPVTAAGSGRVVFSGLVAGDMHVTIQHLPSGWLTGYSNLGSRSVRTGQKVRAGDEIGRSGGQLRQHSPSVVHFALRIDGQYRDPELLFWAGARVRVRLAPISTSATLSYKRPFGRRVHGPVHSALGSSTGDRFR